MGWEYWSSVSCKKTFQAMGSGRLQGNLWRSVVETIYWHISRNIRWSQGWSQYLRERGTKMSFFYLASQELYYLFWFFVEVDDQDKGREAWAVNCLLVVCSFSVLAKGDSILSFSSSEGHAFSLLLGWRYTPASHTPKLVTDRQVWWWLLGFSSLYFKCSCDD